MQHSRWEFGIFEHLTSLGSLRGERNGLRDVHSLYQGHPCKGILNINYSLKPAKPWRRVKKKACGILASGRGGVGRGFQPHSYLVSLYLLNNLKAPLPPSSHETTPKSSKNSSLSPVVKEISYLQVSRSPADLGLENTLRRPRRLKGVLYVYPSPQAHGQVSM